MVQVVIEFSSRPVLISVFAILMSSGGELALTVTHGQGALLRSANETGGGRRRGRPSMSELLHKDGPMQLVAFIVVPMGRWAFLRSLGHFSGGIVLGTLRNADCDPENTFVDRPTIVGLGIVRSWRFVHQAFAQGNLGHWRRLHRLPELVKLHHDSWSTRSLSRSTSEAPKWGGHCRLPWTIAHP